MHKILVILGTPGIGDLIVRLPAIKAIKETYPQATLTVMTRQKNALYEILSRLSFIDECMVQDKAYKKLDLFYTLSLGLKLRAERFNAVAILGRSRIREPLLAYLSGAKHRLGYDTKPGLGRCLLTHITKPNEATHETNNIFSVLKPLHVSELPNIHIELPCSNLPKNSTKTFNRYAIIHATANDVRRRWRAENYAEIISLLADKYHLKTCFVGTQADRTFIERLKHATQIPFINLAGKTTILELISLLKHATCFVGVDSGPMHIASVLNIPIVGLFGLPNTDRWAPRSNSVEILHHPDMNHITVDHVRSAINKIL